jgi:cytidylate kinase
MTVQRLRVAIDGPAGAGKSTVAARVATAFGLPQLDTGAIYRTLALFARRSQVDWDDEAGLAALAARLPLAFAGGRGTEPLVVRLGDEDVSAAIRTPELSQGASLVSRHPAVRAALLPVQRRLAEGGVVAEGRDIGSVVLPDAEVKIFLTASPGERARRRREELAARGEERPLAEVLAEQTERDERDERRATAPLRAAEDAVRVDTDGLTLEQVVARVIDEVTRRTGCGPRGPEDDR